MARKGKPGLADVLTLLEKVTYLGGHPACPGQQKNLTLYFLRSGVSVETHRREPLIFRYWSDLRSLQADSRDMIEQRVTVARAATLGIFALALPKTRATSFLVAEDDEGELIFGVPGINAVELRAGLQPLQKYLPKQKPSARRRTRATGVSGDSDAASRLKRLEELRNAALISEKEYTTRRAAIVDNL